MQGVSGKTNSWMTARHTLLLIAEQPQLDGVVPGSGGKTGGIAGASDGPHNPCMSLGDLPQQLEGPFVICAGRDVSTLSLLLWTDTMRQEKAIDAKRLV